MSAGRLKPFCSDNLRRYLSYILDESSMNPKSTNGRFVLFEVGLVVRINFFKQFPIRCNQRNADLNSRVTVTVLINCIRAFLTERSQAVRIGNSLSDWKSPRGGIPQGTKLGVILFAVMTNNILREWHLRIKFVDDTTALEILPRNGISLLNVTINDIHKFSIEHNMKLNPKKCKEMLINFMQNDNFTIRPTVLGNNTVECVTTYKLLGIIISNDLKWNEHIDYILKKASKRLYSLRILKKVGVNKEGILKVYLTTIRPILEYGVHVWQDIPEFL